MYGKTHEGSEILKWRSLQEARRELKNMGISFNTAGKKYIHIDIACKGGVLLAKCIRFHIGDKLYAIISRKDYREYRDHLYTLAQTGAIVYKDDKYWRVHLVEDDMYILKLRASFFR